MAILLKVTWIDRSDTADAYECIRHIGGNSKELNWKHTHDQAIQSIEEGAFAYYVETNAGMSELQVGLSPDGRKYLKTGADKSDTQVLVNMPTYPIKSEARA